MNKQAPNNQANYSLKMSPDILCHLPEDIALPPRPLARPIVPLIWVSVSYLRGESVAGTMPVFTMVSSSAQDRSMSPED